MKTELINIATATNPAKCYAATAIMTADHKLVSGLIKDYEKATTTVTKNKLVTQICTELSVHAQVKKEIFYPVVSLVMKDHELVPETTVEHATLKSLITKVKSVEPDGEMFDAKIKALSEYVQHHVREEQDEMFPKAKATKLDMIDLGDKSRARKKRLMAQRT